MKRNILITTITFLLSCLWGYAGLVKFMDYQHFRFQLGQSPLVYHLATPLSMILPAAEILLALGLLFKRTRLFGLYTSLFLLLIFTGYIYSILHFSYFIPCSCGGILGKMSWNVHLVFNVAMSSLAFIGILFYGEGEGDKQLSTRIETIRLTNKSAL